VNRTAHFLYFVLITVCLAHPARNEAATPGIDIKFENSSATGRESIHAKAAFYSYGPEIRTTLAAITAYPELHAWIRNTTLLRHVSNRKLEYLVEFEFPWPVGRRWSQVEVHQESLTRISWHQVEGNLKANQGEISIVTRGERVDIEYRAILDIGLPDAWIRSYKKKFVTEFLNAVYHQAVVSQPANGLTLATAEH
jgi:hypothetical protein